MFYRPLVSLNYFLDYRLWGLNPTLSHLVSIGWHLVCVALVGVVAVRWGRLMGVDLARLPQVAPFSMLVFALLPAHAEAVAWIASRADLIATAFGLISLICMGEAVRRSRWSWYDGLAWLAFGIGLFTKESVALLPLMVGIWLWSLHRSQVYRVLPLFGVLALYLAVRTLVVGGIGGYPEGMEVVRQPWWGVVHLGVYLLQMVLPAPLFGFGRDWGDTALFLLAGVGIVGIGVHAPSKACGGWYRLLGVWCVLSLLPVVFFKPSLWHPLNSRYTYLASVWLAIGIGLWLSHQKATLWQRVALGVFMMSYGMGTLSSAFAWRVAGQIAESSLQSLREVALDRPVVLLSIPDHYRGAYIWRTSLQEALALYAPERTAPVYALSRFTMRLKPDTAVRFQTNIATLSRSEDLFLTPEGSPTYPEWQAIIEITPTMLRLERPLPKATLLMRYEGGRFVPVE